MKFARHLAICGVILFSSHSLFASELSPECAKLGALSPAQRNYNTRVMNAMARYLDRARALTSPRGAKARTFEDAVLEAYLASSDPAKMKDASQRLGEMLGVPPEVAEVVVAFYDLENAYKADPALKGQVVEQISHYFPLPDSRGTGAPVVRDTWSSGLGNHSPAKASFDDWTAGKTPEVQRRAGEDDGFWWRDILGSLNTIRASQEQNPTRDLDGFLAQDGGKLWQVYGALVERELVKGQSGSLIPGSAILVGGAKHADGWKVRWAPNRLVIDGLFESKASYLGVARAQDQIRGFLTRLVDDPERVFIFGRRVDPNMIYLNTASGPVSLLEFAKTNQAWIRGDTVDDDFAKRFNEMFSENFYQIAIPKGEPQIDIPVGRYAETQSTRSELQDRFVRLIQKRFSNSIPSPEALREGLFSANPRNRSVPFEFEQYAQYRRTGIVPQAEAGPLWAVRTLPNSSQHLDQALSNLAGHLPTHRQRELETNFPVQPSDGKFFSGRANKMAEERVRNRIGAMIQAHNEWAKQDLQRRPLISDNSLDSKAGLEIALQILNKHAQKIPFEDFSDLETGGLLAIKTLPSFSLKLNTSLSKLAKHLPLDVQKRLESETPLLEDEGKRAIHSRKNQSSAKKILARLTDLVSAHNDWAKGAPDREPILWDSLGSKEGMTGALRILERSAQLINLDEFRNPEDGGLAAIKDLPHYSDQLAKSLKDASQHLPETTQRKLEEEFPVLDRAGTNAMRGETNRAQIGSPAETIRNRLGALIVEHNRWAQQEPGNRKVIPVEGVSKKEGMTNAIRILKESADEVRKEAQKLENPGRVALEAFTAADTGGIYALRKLPNYSIQLPEVMDNLAGHLSPETRAGLATKFPVKNNDVAMAPRASASERVRDRTVALVEAHNEWAAQDAEKRQKIPTDKLATKEGVEFALRVLDKSQHPISLHVFMDQGRGGMLALTKLPGYSKKLGQRIAEMGAHLPEAIQQNLSREFPVPGKGFALDSISPLASGEKVRNRMEALVKAHNEWAQGRAGAVLISLDTLETEPGMRQAIQILQHPVR
jgi:hypothetical protein